MDRAECLVVFKDKLEEDADKHFGILFENGFILCLCCGGFLEPEDYEIIEAFDGFAYVDEVLKEYY